MQINNEQQYQDALTELKLLEEAPAGDEGCSSSGGASWKRPPRNMPSS
jgi:hypothetical protein